MAMEVRLVDNLSLNVFTEKFRNPNAFTQPSKKDILTEFFRNMKINLILAKIVKYVVKNSIYYLSRLFSFVQSLPAFKEMLKV